MNDYPSERENTAERVNSLCLRLFDVWCDTRCVTALAYLMHCWPMIDSTPGALRRLGETMRDLQRYHGDQIDDEAFHALCEMAALIDELVGRPARTVRLTVPGEVPETMG